MQNKSLSNGSLILTAALAMALLGCGSTDNGRGAGADPPRTITGKESSESSADGPSMAGPAMPHRRGDAKAGREVFRFETFGNEGFWTDAMRMPQGMKDAKVTPLDALKAGV